MTKHLRKLIMSFAVSAFLFGALAVQTNAQDLTKVWERSARTGAAEGLPSWYTASSVRGIAEYNGKVYVPDRANMTIQVMDAATGADATVTTPYDLTGVASGLFLINDLNISDDGVVFVGNMTTDASGAHPFKLYWFSNDGGAMIGSTSFSTATLKRLGDRMTVVGSLADNTIEVWLSATAGANPGSVFVLTTTDNGATWDSEEIILSGAAAAIGSGPDVMPLALGRTSDFYVASNASKPARYNAAGEYVTDSEFSSTSRNGFKLFNANGTDYMAIYNYRADGTASGNAVGRVIIYDISDATAPVIVDETDLIGNDVHDGGSIVGDVFVSVNGDGSINLYAFDAANGYVAYTNQVPPYLGAVTNKVFFSEYIEGSSNNKAIEIFNNTDSTVTLANYQIAQTNNGSDWINFHKFAGNANISAGGVYVITTNQIKPELFDTLNANEVLGYDNVNYNNPVHHNGDDARALIHVDPVTNDTTWIDILGEANNRPTDGWDVAGIAKATQNYTLIRKPNVTEGNSTPLGSFGTNFSDSEWIVMPIDFTANLGSPSADLFDTPLAGDYFVPQRKDDAQGFTSLAQALHFVNEAGLSAATTLYITADLTETTGLAIDRDDFTESVNLTIKPAAGVTATLDVISNGGDGIAIIKADNVTIDGSNTPGGDTRDLTITSSDDGLTNLIWTKETVNTIIANTILTYTGAKTTVTGVATNESGAKATDGLKVINNSIGSVDGDFRTAVGVFGYTNNNVTNTSVVDNRLYATYRGIATWRAFDNSFIDNTISIDSPRENEPRYAGIYLALNDGETSIIGNEIVGLQVNRSETAGYAAGILFNASLGTVLVANNVINVDNFANTGAAVGNQVFGIGFDNAAGNSPNGIYHNTIRIGSSDETGVHAAFGAVKHNTTGMFWDFKNNIFEVSQDAANASVMHWPIDNSDNLTADYNNYYVSGVSANVGFYNATGADLAGWQTASAVDANTTDVEVDFVSATDSRLGLSDGDANLAGTPIASVTVDFDGTARGTFAPYKGAFEGEIPFAAPNYDIAEFALLAPADSANIDLNGDIDTEVEFSWETAVSADAITYTVHFDSLDGDFSSPIVSEGSDDNGTTITGTYGDFDDILADLGVEEGGTITLQWTVSASNSDSTLFASKAFVISMTRRIAVSNEVDEKPLRFSLSQNYPNPFNPTSNIRFTLPQANNVRLDVYNINGQLVKTLVNTSMTAGEHTVQFDAGNLASGVYIYRIVSGNFVQSKKMTLIK
ncbi:MAG: SusE domain-containing protein [Balneolaceae bacterium]